jgi:MarR family transcriptional regulator, transcriptional regulator for hemolysin
MIKKKSNLKAAKVEKSIDDDVDFRLYGLLLDTSEACVKARGNELEAFGISTIEARTLFVLQNLGVPSTPAAIAKHVFREHNTISALISRMEKKGLISKTRDTSRKNIWRVALTAKGLKVIKQASQIASIHAFLAELSKEERVLMESCLTRIRIKALKQIARDSVMALPYVAMHNIDI